MNPAPGRSGRLSIAVLAVLATLAGVTGDAPAEDSSKAASATPVADPSQAARTSASAGVAAELATAAKAAPRALSVGTLQTGSLSGDSPKLTPAGTPYQVWTFAGRAGQKVALELSSKAFQPAVFLVADPKESALLGSDRSPNPQTTASLVRVLPKDGTYYVVASSTAAGAAGSYELKLEAPVAANMRGAKAADPKGRYALLAAVEDYPDTQFDLSGPSNDLAEMKALLMERYGFRDEDIVVLQEADVTRRNLLDGIRSHLGKAGPEGVAVLYYSGHGHQPGQNLGRPDEEGPDKSDETLIVAGGEWVLDDQTESAIAGLDAGRFVFIFDSCYSGGSFQAGANPKGIEKTATFAKDAYSIPPPAELDAEPTAAPSTAATDGAKGAAPRSVNHVMLAASKEGEQSYIRTEKDPTKWDSVFTHFFVERVRAGEDVNTLDELMEAVATRTSPYVKTTYNRSQTPVVVSGNGTSTLESLLAPR